MRIGLATLAAGALLLTAYPASACQCAAGSDRESMEHAAAVFQTLDARWNERDAEGFGRVFTEDVSFTFVDRGEGFEGRAALTDSFARRFPTFPAQLRHATQVRETRSIAPGVVAVDGEVEILVQDTDGQDEARLLRSFAIFALVEEEEDGCRIRLIRIWQHPDDPTPT